MQMQHEYPSNQPNDISGFLTPVFSAYKVKKAILFGSHAKGDPTPSSDIDILVDSNLKGLDFVELIEDIRSALQKDIDLFDVRHIEPNSPLAAEILETGVVIYEA
jgi:predicted nucleotidyltransferase